MSLKEKVARAIEGLSDTELRQVAEYVAFLKFRARIEPIWTLDETKLAALYGKFAEEDRMLAEEGMEDYAKGLKEEDSR